MTARNSNFLISAFAIVVFVVIALGINRSQSAPGSEADAGEGTLVSDGLLGQGGPDDSRAQVHAQSDRKAAETDAPSLDAKDISHRPNHHSQGSLLQDRSIGLSSPDVMPDADAIVENHTFNPTGIQPSLGHMVRLELEIRISNDRVMAVVRNANIELSQWAKQKVRMGECEPYSDESPFEPEGRGEATAIVSSHDGTSYRVRVLPGESAPVDVLHDDAWRVALREQIRIRDLLNSFWTD